MNLLEKIAKNAARKAAFGGLLLLGVLTFAAGQASAHPRVVVGVGIGGPVVVRGYYAPPPYYYYGPVYVAPRYRHRPYYRYRDERFHCWRYR